MRKCILRKCIFQKCVFQKCILLKCILQKCIFRKCIFRKCIFRKCIFRKCIFWNCIFWKCIFWKCIFWKLFWPKAYLAQTLSNRAYPVKCVSSELLRACFALSEGFRHFHNKFGLRSDPPLWNQSHNLNHLWKGAPRTCCLIGGSTYKYVYSETIYSFSMYVFIRTPTYHGCWGY